MNLNRNVKRIRSRWLLVALVAAGQLLALLTAAVWLVNWLNIAVSQRIQAAIAAPAGDSATIIDQFNKQVQMIALTLTGIVVLFSTLLTSAIVRRYENRLAKINEHLEELVEVRSQALIKSHSAVIFGLAKLAESRDDQTGQHLERIRKYVAILARQMARTNPQLDHAFIDTLIETSSLHDIGKVGIPDAVLLSPNRLTDEERQIIRKHPLIGGDTLLAIKQVWGDDPFLVTACEIAFAHHERWDGKGYPFGLAGQTIPLAARIVALADVYDALTTRRVYKQPMTHDQAAAIIVAEAGGQFDPAVVDAFKATAAEFARVWQELSATSVMQDGLSLAH